LLEVRKGSIHELCVSTLGLQTHPGISSYIERLTYGLKILSLDVALHSPEANEGVPILAKLMKQWAGLEELRITARPYFAAKVRVVASCL